MKRFFALVLALIMVCALGTAVASADNTDGREHMVLMMYTSTAVQEQFEKELIPFEEANNVDVEVILCSLADYDTKLATMISSGQSPDVMLVAEYQNDQYVSEGMLLDLSEFAEDPEYDYEDFAEGQRNHWTYDTGIYGIACSGAPQVCFYNKDLFEKAGLVTPTELYQKGEWTVDAMIDAAKAIGALGDDIYGINFSRSGDWANWDVVLTPVLRLYGGDAWNDNDHSEVLINSDKSVKGLELLDELMNTGVHPQAGATVDFLAGQLGLWPELYGSVKKMVDLPFEWDVVPMPMNDDGGSTSWMGSAAWGAVAATDKPELAKACVKFLTGKDVIANTQFTFVPTRKSVLLSEVYSTGNHGEVARSSNPEAHGWIIDSIDSIRVKQSHENYQELSEVILEGLDLMYAGALSPRDAADYMAEEMQPYMLAK